MPIDMETGRRPAAGALCFAAGMEAFVEGTEPTERCSPELHAREPLPHGSASDVIRY